MVLNVREVLLLMASETEKKGVPLPINPRVITEWAEGLGLPEKGETLLYTGGLYQLMPYINALVKYLETLESRRSGGFLLKAARKLGLTGLAGAIAKPDKKEVEYSHKVLRAIVKLLQNAGVEFAYNPGADGYSGVLLYDMGLDDVFRRHAARVYESLKKAGARRIITIDPHTTFILEKVYPEYVEGFDLEVVNYLRLLREKGYKAPGKGGRVVIHDPCLYARELGIIEEPRKLLSNAGYDVVEPRRSGRMTYCCGGPVESIAPKLSRKIASTRARELAEKGRRIVTLCPICLANLSRSGEKLEINDISLYLSGEA